MSALAQTQTLLSTMTRISVLRNAHPPTLLIKTIGTALIPATILCLPMARDVFKLVVRSTSS